ncbi:UDP-glycosyltransferase 83A1-like [Mercurialis annua]|uniref:UDP-glycosyltransferase 83A1-like n=1 Tax=Mercurialis annua TaxID=3986 RepID=UPI002160DA06|nr:UDP-glycosyltransferase 83A1-like [Mercurialis annua]
MEHTSEANSHLLLLPFPLQGHIVPFMKLAHKLACHGSKVTVLTTEFLHERIKTVVTGDNKGFVRIVSVPDGLPKEDDRKDEMLVTRSIFTVMPGYLAKFINEQENEEKLTCVIADSIFGWALEIAEKMGLKKAIFFTAAPGALAMILHIPRLIQAGIIDPNDGTMLKNEKIQISPSLPVFNDTDLIWNIPENDLMKKSAFHHMLLVNQNLKVPDWILCNWFEKLEESVSNLLPDLVTIGPLLADEKPTGNFWSEDLSCLTWLDKQATGSVIYVAFGSAGKFNQNQFNELALGLELAGQPFLWVVRSDQIDGINIDYPDTFRARTAELGKTVEWAPQEKVLAHPSIACYVTHCGWNSIMEAINVGVPMLCWPNFTDQFYNRTCVCYGWKIGLELNSDENGIVTRYEVKKKVDELVSDKGINANALKLKELADESIGEGGSSFKNLEKFVEQLKL